MRFGFLEEHRGEIGPIRKACGLMEALRSGFCEYLGRKKSDAQIEREALEGVFRQEDSSKKSIGN